MKNSLRSLLLLSLVALGCEKKAIEAEVQKLPEATSSGANTFGCLINKEAWVAGLDPGVAAYFTPLELKMNEESHAFQLTATKSFPLADGTYGIEEIVIFASGITGPGTYTLAGQPITVIGPSNNNGIFYVLEEEIDGVLPGGAAYTKLFPERQVVSTGKLKGKWEKLKLKIQKIDYRNNALAGTFEFDAFYYGNSKDTYYTEATQGRFDVNLISEN